ncbi:MAG: hypothetical protein ACI9CA_000773 [Natronomonas sp.]|jgi:hypothetical protein
MSDDQRAVSITLNYVLAIAISAVLVTGLLIAGGNFVGDQQESVVRNELSVVGQRLAADLERVDRMVAAGDDVDAARINRSLPTAAVGERYDIELDASAEPELVLTADGADVSVSVTVSNRTPLADSSVRSGSVAVVYDQPSGVIALDES